ncbi:helix-turn-helix domain-containing protein [Erwinia sp. P6884]|uniref:helix-turn-helix domain-containing protein n=1 Tax=Erwinia sp. P6884 TaxID=3141450 RepID=UPI00318BDD5E
MTLTSTEARLARRLYELRLEKGWSLENLAEMTGISRASLSRIERNESSPTASLMNRLCIAYGLTMSRLLSEVEEQGPEYLRLAEQPVWHDRESGYERRGVSPPASQFKGEIIEGRLRGGALIEYHAPPVEGMEQHIWVLSGPLIFSMSQRQWRLEAGECLRFHLSGPTSFHAPDEAGAHYALVVCR